MNFSSSSGRINTAGLKWDPRFLQCEEVHNILKLNFADVLEKLKSADTAASFFNKPSGNSVQKMPPKNNRHKKRYIIGQIFKSNKVKRYNYRALASDYSKHIFINEDKKFKYGLLAT